MRLYSYSLMILTYRSQAIMDTFDRTWQSWQGTEPLLFEYEQKVRFCQLAGFALVNSWGHVRIEIPYPALFPLPIPHPNPIKHEIPHLLIIVIPSSRSCFQLKSRKLWRKKSQIPHPAKSIAKISVTSPIVITMSTRELLGGETKSSFV